MKPDPITVLRQLEWSGYDARDRQRFCPACGGDRDGTRHTPNCPVAACLALPQSDEPAKPSMRAIAEALGFEPDNHNNALKCPYCNPKGLTWGVPQSEEPAATIEALTQRLAASLTPPAITLADIAAMLMSEKVYADALKAYRRNSTVDYIAVVLRVAAEAVLAMGVK